MAKRRKRRGISFGTLMMLLLTCMVCIGCFTILPRLQGNTELHVDATQVFSNLTLEGTLPDLSLRDIPITVSRPRPLPRRSPPCNRKSSSFLPRQPLPQAA